MENRRQTRKSDKKHESPTKKSDEKLATPLKVQNKSPVLKTPQKRGRPTRSATSAKKKDQRSIEQYLELPKSSSSSSDSDSDNFKPDNNNTSTENSISSNNNEKDAMASSDNEKDSEIEDMPIKKQRTPSKKIRQSRSKLSRSIEITEHLVNEFDFDKVVTEWEYELDEDTKIYRKPIFPLLSNEAIRPFLNKESKPKCIMYNCPFCQCLFTYNLVFKNHLYSCEKNINVPEYSLWCCKPDCPFKGSKKQIMINHYFKLHEDESLNSVVCSNESPNSNLGHHQKNQPKKLDSSFTNNEPIQMTKTKQNQLEVSRYYYVEKPEFKFTFDYFNKSIACNYRRLKFLTDFYLDANDNSLFDRFIIGINGNDASTGFNLNCSDNLKFKLPNDGILDLQPFEVYENFNEANGQFKLINAIEQISVLDWAPTKLRNLNSKSQFLAFGTTPSQQINTFFTPKTETKPNNFTQNKVKNLFESSNLIYVCKFTNLSQNSAPVQMFAILNRKLGHINAMKFRPDCGASISDQFNTLPNFDTTFIGYLLTASSNGKAYITCIQDMTKFTDEIIPTRSTNSGVVTIIKNLEVFEFKRQIVLTTSQCYGQCTSADWSQLNGATEVACGYANGAVALFQMNSNALRAQSKIWDSSLDGKDLVIRPFKVFNAHQSFVRVLRWSKLDSSTLATGSTFSRDVKCWDTNNPFKPLIEYEIFATELGFTLHSNNLFIVKDANLKGDNHLYELDLSFNAFNKERDEARSHSSLFYTDGSMSSIDQNDYFNKFLVCDSQGHVIVSSANNPKFWVAKHHLMFNSFSRVCKFDILDTSSIKLEEYLDKEYVSDPDQKSNKIIAIDLERKKSSKQKTGQENRLNSNHINLNNLTMIRWNTNFNYINWYAVASQSGFIFLQRLDELVLNIDD